MRSLLRPSIFASVTLACASSCGRAAARPPSTVVARNDSAAAPRRPDATSSPGPGVQLSETEWRRRLTPEQYEVLREEGTEPAFHNALWNHHAPGTYRCAGCGALLFASDAKFDSGTGWPSFFRPATEGGVGTTQDQRYGMTRTEVHCARCGGHLGHVFDDGPAPTGLRYCINSASLSFTPAPAPRR